MILTLVLDSILNFRLCRASQLEMKFFLSTFWGWLITSYIVLECWMYVVLWYKLDMYERVTWQLTLLCGDIILFLPTAKNWINTTLCKARQQLHNTETFHISNLCYKFMWNLSNILLDLQRNKTTYNVKYCTLNTKPFYLCCVMHDTKTGMEFCSSCVRHLKHMCMS